MDVVPYSTGPAGITGPVFCDTSFLLDAFTRHLQLSGNADPLSATVQRRVESAYAFLAQAGQVNLRLFTSLLVHEEAFHKVTFKFVNAAMRVTTNPGRTWKEFKRNYPGAFAAAIDQGRRTLKELEVFLMENGVELLAHGRQPGGQQPIVELHVSTAARRALDGYDVDAMDAFHYASMLRFGISVAASSDRDWRQFPLGVLIQG